MNVLRVAALAAVYLVAFIASYGALMPAVPPSPGNEPISVFVALLVAALANTAVIAWIVARADAPRWRLAFAIFLALWGIQTVLAQVETLIFPGISQRLPQGFVARTVAAGLVHTAIVAAAAVWLLSRRTSGAGAPVQRGEGISRIAVAASAYVVLYFTCGYFIAWRQPTLAAYYGGADPGNFFVQMWGVITDTPWLVAIQLVRGGVWALLLTQVTRLLQCSRAERMAAAAALSGIASLGLLMPNPYMPFDVRMIHLVETITSNVCFGAFVGWWFSDSAQTLDFGMARVPGRPTTPLTSSAVPSSDSRAGSGPTGSHR